MQRVSGGLPDVAVQDGSKSQFCTFETRPGLSERRLEKIRIAGLHLIERIGEYMMASSLVPQKLSERTDSGMSIHTRLDTSGRRRTRILSLDKTFKREADEERWLIVCAGISTVLKDELSSARKKLCESNM